MMYYTKIFTFRRSQKPCMCSFISDSRKAAETCKTDVRPTVFFVFFDTVSLNASCIQIRKTKIRLNSPLTRFKKKKKPLQLFFSRETHGTYKESAVKFCK